MTIRKSFLFLIIGLVIYSAVAILIWQERYFYDDELLNLNIITSYNYIGIIDFLSTFDFHPPGQYLINKFTYDIFGPAEWLMSLPSLICIGFSAGLAGLIVYRLTNSLRGGYAALFISSLSPLLLMWGWSIRWYPYWTFIAFYSLFILLKMWNGELLKRRDYIILTFLFTAGLYINYLSLLFLAAVILTTLVIDLRKKRLTLKEIPGTALYKISLITVISFLLFSPWLFSLRFQLSGFFNRSEIHIAGLSKNSLAAGVYSFYTGLFGSSIYPWNNEFIILISGMIISLILVVIFFFKSGKLKTIFSFKNKKDAEPVIIFTIIFIIFIVGLSSAIKIFKSYNQMLLPLLISVIIAVSIVKIVRKIYSAETTLKLKRGYSYLLLAIFFFAGIWITGSLNLLNRQHLHKMGLSDPIDSVLSEIKRSINKADKMVLVMTINPVLTYYLSKEKNNNFLLVAPKKNYRGLPEKEKVINAEIIFVENYLGAFIPAEEKYFEIVNYLEENGHESAEPVMIGKDADFEIKDKVAEVYLLPEYRFIIRKYKPDSAWDIEKVLQLNKLSVY